MNKNKCLKIICVFAILTLFSSFIGCSNSPNTLKSDEILNGKYCKLSIIDEIKNDDYIEIIIQDVDTGVIYMWLKNRNLNGQSITPLYNADGSLKTIEDFKGGK